MDRKRKNNNDSIIISKKSKSIDWNKMISPSSIRNYMLDDPLIDWLKYYNIQDINDIPIQVDNNINTLNKKNEKNSNTDCLQNNCNNHTDFIMQQGVLFEENVFKQIIKKHKNYIKIADNGQSRDYLLYEKTLGAMRDGVHIIYQGVLHCYKNNIYGMPDLLIRSDVMENIFNCKIVNMKVRAPLLNGSYHYVVVDVKHSTITLNCNKDYILNTNCVPAYKGQIYMYNMMLQTAQGYMPSCGYILGKKIQYTKQKITYINDNYMECIGKINYKKYDKKIINKVLKAIEWVRKMRNIGHTWKLLPRPSCVELYPNMKHMDNEWKKIKTDLSNELGEITSVWWCGHSKRMIAHSKKIYSWHDERLTASSMDFNDTKTARTIDHILDINRQDDILIRLDDLVNDKTKWRNFGRDTVEFYLDFETMAKNIGQIPEDSMESDIIFMVGLGWIENDNWMFKNFIMENISDVAETNMFRLMWEEVNKIKKRLKKKKSIFIHWTPAEVSSYNKFIKKSGMKNNIIYFDLYKLFINNNIVVNGALNFSLKTIGNAMYNNNMIMTKWDSNSICSNGLDAMFIAYNLYNNNIINNNIMKEIAHYNMIDCKIMWEILTYLRMKCII